MQSQRSLLSIIWKLSAGLVILLLAGILTLPYSFPLLAKYFLAKQGYIVTELKLRRLNWQELSIDSLILAKLSEDTHSPPDVSIALADIEMHYSLRHLLAGKIDSLSMQSADIHITALKSTNDSTSTETRNLKNYLPEKILQWIPIKHIDLKKACINWSSLPVDKHLLCLQLTATFERDKATADFQLHDVNQHTLSGKLAFDRQDQFSFTIFGENRPILFIKNSFAHVEEKLEINGFTTFDLSELQSTLSPLITEIPERFQSFMPLDMTGKFSIDWNGNIPEALINTETFMKALALNGKISGELLSATNQEKNPQAKKFDAALTLHGIFTIANQQLQGEINEGSISINSDLQQFADLKPFFLKESLQTVSLKIAEPIQFTASLERFTTQLTNGSLSVSITENASEKKSLHLNISQLHGNFQNAWNLQGQYRLLGNWDQISLDRISLKNVYGNLSGNFVKNPENILVSTDINSTLNITALAANDINISNLQITNKNIIASNYSFASREFGSDHINLVATNTSLTWNDIKLSMQSASLQPAKITYRTDSFLANGKIEIKELVITKDKETSFPENWQANFSINNQQIVSRIGISSRSKVNIIADVSYDFQKQNGKLRGELSTLQFSEDFNLAKIIKPWKLPLDVVSGNLSATTAISWNASLIKQQYIFSLQNISGHYQDNSFNGLSTIATIDNTNGWHLQKPTTVTIKNIDVGIPIENITFTTELNTPQKTKSPRITLQNFNAELLGGKANADKLIWDSALEKNMLLIKLNGLSIQKLVELEKYEGLEGTGTIDGILPLIVTNDGISIADGMLTARKPGGVIRYQPSGDTSALAAQDYSVDYVMQILKNFNYDSLGVNVSYSPDGTIKLPIALQGKNKDVSDRPIHLNLNLEFNLLNLLKSLKLANKVGEKLEQKVGEKFTPAKK